MDADLQGALLDVRKAFRLLHGYHRRIRDIVELAARVLPMTPYGQSTSVTPMTLRRRDDVISDGGYAEKIVSNAPLTEDNFFMVPKVVE